jgi:uncharacterized protein with HEPN domain
MSDPGLSCEILHQIADALHRIERRFSVIDSPDDFLATDDGIDRLDAICMMLIAIGESLKNLDRLTGGTLLTEYPSVDWKGAKGMRDVISHHYFDLNAEAVFGICKNHIPGMASVVQAMINDLKNSQRN